LYLNLEFVYKICICNTYQPSTVSPFRKVYWELP